jgi:prophage regulatory protein
MDGQDRTKKRWEGTSYLRLKSIIGPEGPIPISKSAWMLGVKQGRFPRPIRLASRTSIYAVSEIQALLDRLKCETDSSLEGGK